MSGSIKNLSITVLLLSLVSLSVAARVEGELQVHPWFAAKCIAKSDACGPFYAKYSGSVCLEKTNWDDQPEACLKAACPWCQEWNTRSMRYPCGSDEVKGACKKLESNVDEEIPMPEPTKEKEETAGNSGKCIWRGEGTNIVIDLGKVPLATGWDHISRDGYKGIIFNRSPARGISPKGKYGKFCFNVQAPMDGKYYFTAISYAPHNTEHNDVWVESEKGFELWQHGDMREYKKPGEWLKAYQNNGKKGMSEHFKTIDFDGHRFIIPNVREGEIFQVCIAGRSKKYEMYRLILKKCEEMYCKGGIMKGDMLFDLEPSQCIGN